MPRLSLPTVQYAAKLYTWHDNMGSSIFIFTWSGLGRPSLWQYRLWSFKFGDIKLKRFLPKNQHTQRKSLNFENWISMGLRSFQKSEFQKSNISILPCTKLMNNEILVVFQCEKWFTYQTTWFKTHLLRFFNWKLSQIFDFINKKQ